MQISVNAANVITGNRDNYTFDIDLNDFDDAMDSKSIVETLDIIICQDLNVVDVDEVDLYTEAERIYQVLNNLPDVADGF